MKPIKHHEITPEIQLIKNKVDKERIRIHKIPGVVATGITHSSITKVGVDTPDNQLVVYVKDTSVLKDLPQVINGVKVVYTISSGFKPVADTNRYRPIKQGSEITSTSGLTPGNCWVGTLGGFPILPDGTKVILSNNHVIANDTPVGSFGKIGDIIYQPGCITEGIGTLANWIPLTATGINLVDAAYALITPGIQIDEYTLCNYAINKTIPPVRGMNILKTGRTTGCTMGTIESIDGIVDVDYSEDPNNPAIVHFENQIITTPGFCAGGDSGSVVVTNDANRNAVGLLFAADDTGATTVSPMTYVEQLLGISFPVTTLPPLPLPQPTTIPKYVLYAGVGLAALVLLSIAS